MRYLRLFLIIRKGANTIETKVYRDLETLTEEWNELKGQDTTALIHAGFDCPHDQSVATLFDKCPGKLLVTESLRWALPPEYSVFPVSIGSCEFDDGRNEVPTYIGTDGWGMTFPEKELKEIAKTFTVTKPICPWLEHISRCNSELFLKLALRDVVDDESFALIRNKMPPDECLEVERIKLAYLKERANKDNLWELLNIAPESILNMDLSELDLTVRLSNIFRRNNIVKVGDLKKRSTESLLDLKNMGRKSLGILTELIWNALTIPEPLEDDPLEKKIEIKENTVIANTASTDTLFSIIEKELKCFDERERCIVKSRWGYEGTRKTLDQIGKNYSITRERVRQIESKIIKRIERMVRIRLVAKIKSALIIQRNPLDVEFLELEDDWFRGFLGKYEYLAGIIESLSNNELHILRINGRSIVTVISQEEWEEIIKECISHLKTEGMVGWTRKEIEIFLDVIANKYKAPELAGLLRRQLEEKMLFAQREHAEVYVGFGSQIDNLVIAVLTESEKPLQITEISKRIKDKYQRNVKLCQITNSTSGALLLGRGTYGLWKHINLEQREIDDIIDSIEKIVEADKNDKQWSAHELLERLLSERYDLADELNPYLVETFLSKSNKLVSLGRFLWVRKGVKEQVAMSRMDITKTFEAILEQAGKPLSAKELVKRISNKRSIYKNPQIHQGGRLIAISPGVWGLIERDIPLSPERREKLLDTLVDILNEKKRALHITEIKDALSCRKFNLPESLREYTIYRFAQNDARIKLGKGQILGLTEWPNMWII